MSVKDQWREEPAEQDFVPCGEVLGLRRQCLLACRRIGFAIWSKDERAGSCELLSPGSASQPASQARIEGLPCEHRAGPDG
jgi:hypothetical protein